MNKKIIWMLIPVLILTGCLTVSQESASTKTALQFVTSTLPPTKPGITLPTETPIPLTETPNPLTPSATSAPVAACKDSAILVDDVNYPDDTVLSAGEKFTKTWKLQNVGRCKWTGYTIAFASGDRMDSPDAAAVPETEAGKPVEVSIDLVAPASDGTYQGNFELRNAKGVVLQIGTEATFWVKIKVGAGDTSNAVGTPVVSQAGNCTYTTNDGYVQTLIGLINAARTKVGRGTLTVNQQLMDAAQAHSLDMACKNFLNHSGSDGTWTGDRIAKTGYPNSYYLEVLAIGLAQDAMNQWKNDKDHWDAVLNSRVTEIGVGYVYSKFSSYGGYWTVDMGGP
ncbi:MAG: NBR1-Ig-like domain-containing protein [Chloroflexota bacterium]